MIEKVIRRVDGKYVLFTRDGKRRLGTHDTKEEAMAQERAIEMNKGKRPLRAQDIHHGRPVANPRPKGEIRHKGPLNPESKDFGIKVARGNSTRIKAGEVVTGMFPSKRTYPGLPDPNKHLRKKEAVVIPEPLVSTTGPEEPQVQPIQPLNSLTSVVDPLAPLEQVVPIDPVAELDAQIEAQVLELKRQSLDASVAGNFIKSRYLLEQAMILEQGKTPEPAPDPFAMMAGGMNGEMPAEVPGQAAEALPAVPGEVPVEQPVDEGMKPSERRVEALGSKAWSDEARAAAAEARRGRGQGAGSRAVSEDRMSNAAYRRARQRAQKPSDVVAEDRISNASYRRTMQDRAQLRTPEAIANRRAEAHSREGPPGKVEGGIRWKPGLGKAWSDEARAAAVESRRGGARSAEIDTRKYRITNVRKPGGVRTPYGRAGIKIGGAGTSLPGKREVYSPSVSSGKRTIIPSGHAYGGGVPTKYESNTRFPPGKKTWTEAARVAAIEARRRNSESSGDRPSKPGKPASAAPKRTGFRIGFLDRLSDRYGLKEAPQMDAWDGIETK